MRQRNHAIAYYCLALLLSVAVTAELFFVNYLGKVESGSYDFSIKYRVLYNKPDPSIVIVDIDEKSLSLMGAEYGRWPWPRAVLAEFIENVQLQSPKAIVFDILFSEPDIYNPESDAYLNDITAAYDNLFYPMIRLPEHNDALSQLRPGNVPGLTRLPGEPTSDKPFAAILPFLSNAVASGRMGTTMITPDDDGISRQYDLFYRHDGWAIPSMPMQIASQFKEIVPRERTRLINWRGGLNAYPSVSFIDVYHDFLRSDKKRSTDEFKDKIIIIGSTAPSLHDLRATPVSKAHPGVEILATSIDNAIHDDFIHTFETPLVPLLTGLLVIWLTALAFASRLPTEVIDSAYGASQSLLLFIAFASINAAHFYTDLSTPVLFGVFYFTAARFYQTYSKKTDSRLVWENRFTRKGHVGLGVVSIQASRQQRHYERITLGALRRTFRDIYIEKIPTGMTGLEVTFGQTYLLFNLFERNLDQFNDGFLKDLIAPGLLKKSLTAPVFAYAQIIEFTDQKATNQRKWKETAFSLLQKTLGKDDSRHAHTPP
jgi:adenylate cyclase